MFLYIHAVNSTKKLFNIKDLLHNYCKGSYAFQYISLIAKRINSFLNGLGSSRLIGIQRRKWKHRIILGSLARLVNIQASFRKHNEESDWGDVLLLICSHSDFLFARIKEILGNIDHERLEISYSISRILRLIKWLSL